MPRAPSPPAVGGGFGGSGEQGVAELRPQVLLWVLGGAGPLASRPPSPGASSGVWFPFARRRGAGWEQNRLWLRNTEAYKLQQQGGDGIVVHTAASLLPLACSRVRLVLGAAEARFKARGLLYAVFFPPRHFFGQNHALVLQSHGVRRQAGVTQGISQVGNRIHHRSTQQTLHSRGAAAVLGSSTQALSSPSDPLNSFNSSVHAGLHQCWVSRRGRAGEAQGQKTGQHTEISPMFNKGIQVFLPFP